MSCLFRPLPQFPRDKVVVIVAVVSAKLFIMYFLVLLLVFLTSLCGILFARDGFINREAKVYNETLAQPWLERTVLLKAADTLYK